MTIASLSLPRLILFPFPPAAEGSTLCAMNLERVSVFRTISVPEIEGSTV